jgi:hypothetical protein
MNVFMKQLLIVVTILVGLKPAMVIAQPVGFETKLSPDKHDELNTGHWYAGLSGLGGFSSGVNRSSGFWSVTPQVGFTPIDRLVVGVQAGLGRDYAKRGQSSSLSGMIAYHYFSIAPEIYVRYYFFDFRIRPFVQLSTGVNRQWGSFDNDAGGWTSDRGTNYIGAGTVGASLMLGKRFALEAMYNHRFFTNSRLADANDKVKLRIGLSLLLRK